MVRVWLTAFAVLFSLAGCRDHSALSPEYKAMQDPTDADQEGRRMVPGLVGLCLRGIKCLESTVLVSLSIS
jgi:hypothetical protein